ncbi:MAG: 5'/3'-nucleotidase SurE [Opitutaceae bacterium]
MKSSNTPPHVLVTNDDGYESAFLHELVNALAVHFTVSVAAPRTEQSWIGRAVTRHNAVAVAPITGLFAPGINAWSIDGTPSDCVNIALGNLLQTPPDIVVSGINIGYNTTNTLILSSGTVAGAVEGAQWGLPAIAFSKCIDDTLFEAVQGGQGQTNGALADSVKAAAQQAAQITKETLRNQPARGMVLNINFPAQTTAETQIKDTYPGKLELGSLFEETTKGVYQFRFRHGTLTDPTPDTDRAALENGYISRSLLDFSRIGIRP